ncbi:hypothetical protein AMATHDRAFT_7240 [Amanita thiersii Skay4041]|uniref:Uncharacterized protein n=1 Tax=Amanita thiersii Skay4041 TaxID=703135 RepID=A0A2A9NFB0_9AGAR|nr:hypothetical protein AMATHDRAFT_7240 [Amanita thiersii Skay4041]
MSKAGYYSVNMSGSIGWRMETGPPILHNNLRSLNITFDLFPESFFDRLILPALTGLYLYRARHQIGEPPVLYPSEDELLALFTRSKCKLDTLELRKLGYSLNRLIKHESCCKTLEIIAFRLILALDVNV